MGFQIGQNCSVNFDNNTIQCADAKAIGNLQRQEFIFVCSCAFQPSVQI